MTPEVSQAIEEIKQLFPGCSVAVEPEPQGGAYVIVDDVPIGDLYDRKSTWFGFLISFQYPRADVYPHFVDGAIQRSDRRPHGTGISATQWRGRSVLQISRRSNRLDPAIDTAATKLAKVMMWFSRQ